MIRDYLFGKPDDVAESERLTAEVQQRQANVYASQSMDDLIRRMRGIGASDLEIHAALGVDLDRVLAVEGTVEGGLEGAHFDAFQDPEMQREFKEGAQTLRDEVRVREFEREEARSLQRGAQLAGSVGLFDILGQ
jgi:predicted RNA-binding Zn ribbon-like protein